MRILDILYPPVCPFCGEVQKPGTGICPSCRKMLPDVREPRCMRCGKPVGSEEEEYCRDCTRRRYAFDQGRSLWLHVPPVSKAVYQFKFHNKRCYAAVFAKEMARSYGKWVRECQVEEILPVPLHASRRRMRGYNQAELLADALSKELHIPVGKNVIFRVRRTKPQRQLDDREREENLRGAFGISRQWRAPSRVLVVDDIYTTGSTVHRIAKLLKKAGVEKVYFLTISIGQGL